MCQLFAWRLSYVLIALRFKIVLRESSRFGLPGDRENIVKLNADHSGVCKFGLGQDDQDNFELVRSNIKDLCKSAIRAGELSTILSSDNHEHTVELVGDR